MSYKKIFLFWVFIFLSFIFLILSLKSLTKKYLLVIPIFGGEINEGVIDIPLYLNPVLAKNEVEKDINSLIYSSLFKKDINGDYIQDIVEDNILSEDKKTLNLKIKENIKFQDGKPLNADDVIFTFTKIKDKELSSNLNIYLEDINIEKVDDFNLKIEMKKPYFFIKESLSFGILPKHIWEKYNNQEFILSEKNLNPIGSGPYKIDEILKKNNISKEYRLITFNKYFKEKPFLKNINFKVYENENDLFLALQKGQIDSTNYLNENYFSKLKNKNIASSNLSNIFSLAFNINKNKNLSNKNFRNAIAYSIDRTEISKNIFYDYVNPNPLNDSIIFDKNISKDYLVKTFSKTESKKIKDPKTKKISTISNSTISPEINNLELSISTLDIGNLKEVAENIAKQIQNNLNIKVNVLVYNQNDFSNILKERNYEILLFGSILEKDIDIYAFLHSSQKNYPGLNISGYLNNNIDKYLEKLKETDEKIEREKIFNNIIEEVSKEVPYFSIYSNNSNYILEKKLYENIKDYIPKKEISKSQRFINIEKWYIYKERIYKWSNQQKLINFINKIIN